MVTKNDFNRTKTKAKYLIVDWCLASVFFV